MTHAPHVALTGPVEEALEALRAGRPVLVTDAADREDEGDVILAGQTLTAQWMAWTIRHTSGFICAPMTDGRADALQLPLMVPDNADPFRTAYTVTVDASSGVTTGISAADRALTIRTLADPTATAADVIRPGHVVPIRARGPHGGRCRSLSARRLGTSRGHRRARSRRRFHDAVSRRPHPGRTARSARP